MKSKNYKGFLFLVLVFTFLCTVCLAGRAIAQEKGYPQKQIDMLTGFPPGGPIDVGTRIVVEELTKELKVPITIGYKPGSNGAVAISYVMHAKPDGYTLLATFNVTITIPPALEKNPTYDPVNGFIPIALCGMSQGVLTANTSSKLTSFDVMMKFAKENPGKLMCVTSGLTTSWHLILEYLRNKHGVNITHVPVKGAAQVIFDLLGNHVDLAGSSLTPALPHLKTGKLRGLVTSVKLKEFPEVPTWAEVGLPEAKTFDIWLGFFAPPNLPKPILNRLSAAVDKVMHLPSMVQSMENAGYVWAYIGPDKLKEKISEEYKMIREITETSGLVK